jgi:hypothetical protein
MPKDDEEGKIINEIAKKFNNGQSLAGPKINKLGIDKVIKTQTKSDPSMYGVDTTEGKTFLSLSNIPALPSLVGHELIHANFVA